MSSDSETFRYGVFIPSSHKDEGWVVETLLPRNYGCGD
jgi:hypothetical protein